MKRFLGIWIFGLVVGLPSLAALANPESDFARGNQLYSTGKYTEARGLYESLAQGKVQSAVLYYNLGNTYFKLGNWGRAIWAYEKALRLDSNLEEAKHNLEVARDTAASLVKDRLEGAQRMVFWRAVVERFTLTEATWWFFTFWYLAFGLFITVLLLRSGVTRALLIALTSLVAVVAICFGLIYFGRIYVEERVREGVVLDQKVEVREGPRAIATKAFEVHGGLKVEIISREDQWLKIRLRNGLEGWVRGAQVGEL